MSLLHKPFLAVVGLLSAGLTVMPVVRSAHASDFTAFAADEDVCRRAGAEAIGTASGPSAASRYDMAYRRCMAMQGRRRQMGAYADGAGPVGNPHGFEFPAAFYSIPYATPGYGYDGFSY